MNRSWQRFSSLRPAKTRGCRRARGEPSAGPSRDETHLGMPSLPGRRVSAATEFLARGQVAGYHRRGEEFWGFPRNIVERMDDRDAGG